MLRVTTHIQGGSGGNQWSTHYFGGSTSGEATVAAQAVTNFWEEVSSAIHTSYAFQTVSDVDQVDPVTGLITATFNNPEAPVVGDSTAEPLPWATQGLIRWRTGDYVNGRELRGRTFIPGWTEAAQTAGVPAVGAISEMNDAGSVLLADAAGAGGLAVYSPTHGVWSLVVSRSVWDRWAVLRSRRD